MQIVEKPWKDEKVVYTFNYTLPGSGKTVKFHPITMKEIKQILMYENASAEEVDNVLDEMITSCVVSPDFNIDELYLQDRFSLMIEMRIRSEGGIYEFDITCPKCKSQSHQNIDLNQIETKERKGETKIKVKIDDRLSVFVDAITRGDQKEIDKIQKNTEYKSIKEQLNEKIFLGLIKSIKRIEFDGKVYNIDFADAAELVDGLTKDQFKKISDAYGSIEFGRNFVQKIGCPHLIREENKQVPCGYTEDFRIPVESFFL